VTTLHTTKPKQQPPNKTKGSKMSNLNDDFASDNAAADEIMDLDFSDVFEEEVLPTGTEAKLRCIGAERGTDKNGASYWRLRYANQSNEKAKHVSYFLGFPLQGFHDARQTNNKKKAFMEWKQAHGIPLTQPVALSECVGLEAWALLSQTESPQYGLQNEVRRWIAGSKSNGSPSSGTPF